MSLKIQASNLVHLLIVLLFSHYVVSDSLRSHGLQPARLLCAQDSPARILEWVVVVVQLPSHA